MNDHQKEIIEKIVYKLKHNKNGMMHKDVLYKYFDDENIKTSIMNLLQNDLKFIQLVEETAYRLTAAGYNFSSFENIKNNISLNEQKDKAETENILITIQLNKWLLKTKWLPYVLALLSFSFSIYTYFEAKKNIETFEIRLEKLEITIGNTP